MCEEPKAYGKGIGRERSPSLNGSQHLTAGIKGAPICSPCPALHQGAVLVCPWARN